MKTPVQEIYDQLRASKEAIRFNDLFDVVDYLLDIEQVMLEKEKDAIMEAHFAPRYGCFSENFYNERYNTKDNA